MGNVNIWTLKVIVGCTFSIFRRKEIDVLHFIYEIPNDDPILKNKKNTKLITTIIL